MNKIALIASKNEAWIIEKCLTILNELCDLILISDGDSTDGSLEIYKKFKKVRLVNSHKVKVEGQNRRSNLLEASREIPGDNILFILDSDELPTFPERSELNKMLLNLKKGEILEVPWLWLWKSPLHYRNDNSVWSNRWMPFIFFDDRISQYDIGDWHESRTPGKNLKTIRTNFTSLIHFATVPKNRFQSRQRYCMMKELLSLGKDYPSINLTYVPTKDERNIRLDKLELNVINNWEKIGVELHSFDDFELNWHDIEILRIFKKYGVEKFFPLNIWDVNWEYKRQLGLGLVEDIPDFEILDKRNFEQRLYHYFLNKNIDNPFWRNKYFIRYKIIKILKVFFPKAYSFYKNQKMKIRL
jgi:hypothetical protein